MRTLAFSLCTLASCGWIASVTHADQLGPKRNNQELGSNSSYTVLISSENDSYQSLAKRYLGDSSAAWRLRKINDSDHLNPGQVVVIPKIWRNKIGLDPGRYQTIPILTYHHFGSRSKRLSVTPVNFRQQLNYLRENNYNIVTLREVSAFLNGELALPPKTVAITIDDGYRSTYEIAFPLLQEFNYPATVFVYSDFMNRGGMNTQQLKNLLNSGLIEIQPHSKTHDNMTHQFAEEEYADYQMRMKQEVIEPAQKIENLLPETSYIFAFPFGATTTEVLQMLVDNNYSMAATVERGSNGFFAHPFLLKRTMIFHEHTLEDFAEILVTSESY